GAADLALAGRDSLDRVGRALAAHDLHVEALVLVPALLERRVVRHVLAGRHEVEDQRPWAERLGLGGGAHGDEHEGEDGARGAGSSGHRWSSVSGSAIYSMGGPRHGPPYPPKVRTAPAEPWRSSVTRANSPER